MGVVWSETKKTQASHGMDSSFILNFEIIFIIDMAGAHQKPHLEAD